MRDLENILAKFREIVSPNFCDDLAKECRLVQRSTSRLKGYEFAQALMIPNAFLEAETLNSLAVRMHKINKLCDLSAPALSQRLNTKFAENFMKACLGKVLKEISKSELKGLSDLTHLSQFNRILIEDSTKAELHKKLGDYYKGAGGSASKSSVKINYIFDYHSERFVDLEFCPGNIPDQSLSDRVISILQKGDLILRDLGYYALARLQQIEQQNAYYISRFKPDILVYETPETSEPLDLAKFLDKKNIQGVVDVTLFIGKERHPVRLVARLLDKEAIDKRRRNANRSSQRTGAKISKKKLSLLKYSIFITKIPPNILSAIAITVIYRARWRIELIFKEWKTCLKIHLFKGYNKERFHCLLFGRLIMILLMGAILPPIMKYAQKLGKEVSSFKVINYMIADHIFSLSIQDTRVDKFIDQLMKDLPKRLCMDKRKRLSLRTNIKNGNDYYKTMKNNELQKKVA